MLFLIHHVIWSLVLEPVIDNGRLCPASLPNDKLDVQVSQAFAIASRAPGTGINDVKAKFTGQGGDHLLGLLTVFRYKRRDGLTVLLRD